MFYQPTIEDARGCKIDLFSGLDSSAVREILSKEERTALNKVMKEDFFGNKKKPYPIARMTINVIGLGFIFAFISMVISNLPRFGGLNSLSAWIGAGFGFAFVIIFGLRVRMSMKTMNADRPYARKMISFQRCPGCLYSLATLAPETDGCTVCPECGGAWKLS